MRRSAKVDVCPARSPHSNSLCVLTDTAAAHFSGYVRNGLHSGDTVVWAATPEDHERWEINHEQTQIDTWASEGGAT